MKFATIGTSPICQSFINASKLVKNMTHSAVFSRNENTGADFAKKNGVEKVYTSLSKLADDPEIDSVYIASPNVFHYEQSKIFINAKKNVLVEKPAATTLPQMEELYELSDKNGVIYAEAIMSIHTEGFKALQSAVLQAGKIYSANINFSQLSSKYPLYEAGENPNIFNKNMHTGCLMDIGVYNLYLAAALFGEPEKIISDAVFLQNGCDAAGSAILKYKDFLASLNYSKVGQGFAPSEIIGDKSTVSVNSVSQCTGIEIINKSEKKTVYPDGVSKETVMSGEADFFERICRSKDKNDTEYIFSKNTALTVRKICDAIRKQNKFAF